MSQYDPSDYDESDPSNPYKGHPPIVPRQTSGLAIASLVCGLVFCVPMITSTLAVVFGFAGIRKTRDPYVGGRGMAISGLILGLVGIGFWLVAGSVFYLAYQTFDAERVEAEAVASQVFKDLSEQKVDAALGHCGPGVTRAALEAAAASFKDSGPFNELVSQPRSFNVEEGQFRFAFEGTAMFSRDRRRFFASMAKDGAAYKVERLDLK